MKVIKIFEKYGNNVTDFAELLDLLNDMFLFIAKIDIEKDTVDILHNKTKIEYPFEDNIWSRHLNYYLEYILEHEREMIANNLSSENLLNFFNAKQSKFYLPLPAVRKNGNIRWLGANLKFLINNNDKKIAYLAIQETKENLLLKNIVDIYVYNNCDYFIYLDAKKNSYTMFSASKAGTPLPAIKSNNYEEEMVKYVNEFAYEKDREKIIRNMRLENVLKALNEKGVFSFTYGLFEKEKGYRRKQLTYRYYNKTDQSILLTRTDLTDVYLKAKEERKKLEEALERASRDFLTGLLNLQGMQERIIAAISKDEYLSALLFIDLDHFKKINDTLGHQMGDEVLCSVADILKQITKIEDVIGRLGGDEFVVLLRDIKSKENAQIYAKKLIEEIEKISLKLEIPISTSASIGLAFFPDDGKDYKTLIKRADQNVYKVKSHGKNGICIE